MNRCESQVRAIKKMCSTTTLLPAEYQQVEYLQASGTQYILTSIPAASYVETRCTGGYTGTNVTSAALVGARNNNADSGRYIVFCLRNTTGKAGTYLRFAYGSQQETTIISGYNKHTIIFNDSNRAAYLNGTEVVTFNRTLNTDSQQNIMLFGMSGYSTTNYNANGYLNIVTFYNNQTGALIGCYIPCYRKSDSKPGMYDTVSKTFFTNEGTGEFTVGPDV